MIETKEELKYLMQYYGMTKVRVLNGHHYLGEITPNMEYKKSRTCSYRIGYEHLAYRDVINMVNKDMDDIKWYDKNKSVLFTTHLIYNSENMRKAETEYRWYSDIEKAQITTKTDSDGKLVLVGTLSQLIEFLSYANDHYIYCHGTNYTFDNEEVTKAKRLIDNYGFPTNYEWHHVGIVD